MANIQIDLLEWAPTDFSFLPLLNLKILKKYMDSNSRILLMSFLMK